MNEPNGKMEFTYQFMDTAPKVVVTLSPESTLDEAVEAFELFLGCAGYSTEGILRFVEDATQETEETQ